jgi:radical SAM superfamily enzyme YgiQ (UPF0313 family)
MKIGLLTFPEFNNDFKHKLEPSVLYVASKRQQDSNIFLYDNLPSDDIDIYLASIYTVGFDEFKLFSKKVGNEKIIAGGYHSTAEPFETHKYAKIVIKGLSSGVEDYFEKDVEGIFDGQFQPININRNLFDIKVNKQAHPDILPSDIIGSINIGIGCQFGCGFCITPMMSKRKVYFKNDLLIKQDIDDLKLRNCNVLFIRDENFTAHENLPAICSLIKAGDFKVVYSFATANSITKENIKILKDAGWHSLCIGAEYPSLKLKKNNNFDKAIELCNKYDIGYALSYIVNDSKSIEDVEIQFNLIKESAFKYMPIKLSINFLKPFPGTKIYNSYKDKLNGMSYSDFYLDYPLFSNEKNKCNNLLISTLLDYYYSSKYSYLRKFDCNDSLHLSIIDQSLHIIQ